MQYTPNYNLITVEGTDVVNPLVQMNPNFTDIDAAMFANKQASIGTATELTAGTVHSITRTNTDSNYFRFTATSNWTSGDSMSVDGVSVSVYLTDGTVPGTGAYIINSEVFGMIAGSRVTLFLSSAPVTSLDADQVTFDPTGTGLDPSDTDVDKAIKELDTLISGITPGATITALWTNPDTSQQFDAQTIYLDNADYDFLLFEILYNSGYYESQIVPKGKSVTFTHNATTPSTYINVSTREMQRITDTSYSVHDCLRQNTGSARSVDNTFYIPAAVYGIKI